MATCILPLTGWLYYCHAILLHSQWSGWLNVTCKICGVWHVCDNGVEWNTIKRKATEKEWVYSARGLAWMVTLLIHISCSGLAVFSLTGTLSKSSSVSQPSIILSETEKLIICYSSLVRIPAVFLLRFSLSLLSHTHTILTFQRWCTSCPGEAA